MPPLDDAHHLLIRSVYGLEEGYDGSHPQEISASEVSALTAQIISNRRKVNLVEGRHVMDAAQGSRLGSLSLHHCQPWISPGNVRDTFQVVVVLDPVLIGDQLLDLVIGKGNQVHL